MAKFIFVGNEYVNVDQIVSWNRWDGTTVMSNGTIYKIEKWQLEEAGVVFI